MADTSYDALATEVLATPVARAAFYATQLRRKLGRALESARLAKGISIRALAARMGSSASQVQRVLHKERGGSLTLRTVIRAGNALGLRVSVKVE